MLDFLSKGIKKVFGTKHERDLKKHLPLVNQINERYEQLKSLNNDQLREQTNVLRARISEYLSDIDSEAARLRQEAIDAEDIGAKEQLFKDLDELQKERDKQLEVVLEEILPDAFALVKETAFRFKNNETLEVTVTDHDRNLAANSKKDYVKIEGNQAIWKNSWTAGGGAVTWDMVHYDVQLIGGMMLHQGKIAEMATGEGKTLVATLPAFLNGLSGEGVHVITVNDYLARRDSEWVGPIFEFLFLTIDCIDKYQPHSEQRRQAYRSDITYGTNNEFGFDYLRDNMVRSSDEMVQRKHHYAMIDEVDSVLIDDARTPLIISGPVGKDLDDQEYIQLRPKVEKLLEAQRKMATQYLADAKKLVEEGAMGVEEGEAGMALLRAHRALPKYRPLIKFLSEEGNRVLLQKVENHYMQEQSKHMHKVDAPLLFTIDEKNRQVELTENGVEYLSKGSADANFFVMPDITLEMMEIESNEALSVAEREEAKSLLSQDFSVKSKRLHAISQLLKAYTLFERDEEYVVMEGKVKIVDEQTGRLMEGRRYSDGLHQALEAKENVEVGQITQTYATVTLQNYFRMYHKLAGMTGTAETESSELWEIYKLDVAVIPTNRPIVRDDREDMVFKTAREKFNAVIEEIVSLSQAGRPVLVGTTSVDVSEKLSRMLKLRNIQHNVLNAKQHQREAEIITEAGRPGNVTIATNMAGRGTDIKISEQVKKAGGLAIIGTERHDSRRVDRQLRGRAGRQGDPGSSQFYVSLEDNLMRLFQSERIAKLMDRMGHEDGTVIQHSMVTRSIERAQKKVEENNFGIRKRLLEYDDVMNIQREAIYQKRRNALAGERLSVDLNSMFGTLIQHIADTHKATEDFEQLKYTCLTTLGFSPDITETDFRSNNADNLAYELEQQFREFYQRKEDHIIAALMPGIKNVYETQRHRYSRIAIPFTDHSNRVLPIAASIEDAVKSKGRTIMRDIEKAVTLTLIDEKWKDHLRTMDELKDSVQAASFEQRDPLVVYKMEAYNEFEKLVMTINRTVTSYLAKGTLVFADGRSLEEAREQRTDLSKVQTSREGEASRAAAQAAGGGQPQKVQTIVRSEKKVGRNDLCPCGSGKKYKHCHG
jgi:preprotein translocase subunit SecA